MRRLLDSLRGPDIAEQDAAWRRAEVLLEDSLTPGQLDDYRARGYLEISSRMHPGRTYRIDGWRPVAVYEHGHFVGAVCIGPREHLPGPDVVLARKLMIEGAEADFLSSGNWLQPTWRPRSAAPTLLLVLALVVVWTLHLVQQGAWAMGVVAAAIVILVAPLTFAFRQRSRR